MLEQRYLHNFSLCGQSLVQHAEEGALSGTNISFYTESDWLLAISLSLA
jgi:hypothetical protein